MITASNPSENETMKKILTVCALALTLLAYQPAQAAEEWGLPEEEVTRFDAKVVDILCELTGDCPTNCGNGSRQLGLLDDAGTLHLAIKNSTPFTGASWELLQFCGKTVTADGLFTTNKGYRIFALQFLREAPDGKWQRANRFTGQWAAKYGFAPDSQEAKQWFRNDPEVKRLIAEDGIFGLGAEADKAYFEANQ
jgi:hypothetical protein